MIVRTAILEGTVAAADRDRFDRHMSAVVLPAIGFYPGIVEVKLRRTVEVDEGAPPVYMAFDLYFKSLDDMRAALASPIRQQVREEIAKGVAMFKGRVYHIVSAEAD